MTDRPDERARYLVELAAPEAGWQDVERMMQRARGAANGASSGPRFIRSIFVPEDCRFYLLYEAESAQQARIAAAEAELEVVGGVQTLRTEEDEAP